jgi:hypothetical protein
MASKMTGRWYCCHASVDGKCRGREHLFRDGSDRAELAASEKALFWLIKDRSEMKIAVAFVCGLIAGATAPGESALELVSA